MMCQAVAHAATRAAEDDSKLIADCRHFEAEWRSLGHLEGEDFDEAFELACDIELAVLETKPHSLEGLKAKARALLADLETSGITVDTTNLYARRDFERLLFLVCSDVVALEA